MQSSAIAEAGAGLVGRDIVGDQAQPQGEAVVALIVVGVGAACAEAEEGISAIGADPGAPQGGLTDAAGKAGSDELITLAAVEAGVEPEAGGNEVADVELLGAPLRQGHPDVIAHALANHQIGPRGMARTGGGGGIAIAEVDGEGRSGDLRVPLVGQIDGGEVLPVVDAGVIAEGGAGLQRAAGPDVAGDLHLIGDDDEIAAPIGRRSAIPSRQQGRHIAGIQEADGVAAHLVVGPQHQRGAIAPIDLQVGRRQRAVQEREAGGQGDAGDHIEGPATAPVLDGRRQAQPISAIYVGDAAIHRIYVGDRAGEGDPAAARCLPTAGGAGHCAVAR
ncbi:hypothetical protein D3C71_678850 [compost metagenome]